MLKRLRTAHPILYCILSEVLFLGSMVVFSLLATIVLAAAGADFDTMDGYLFGSVQEAVGLDCQMLLYLFSLTRDAGGRFTGAQPAGVLYLLADPAPQTLPRGQAAQAVEYQLDGLVRDEQKIFDAMDADETGKYLPFGYRNGAPSPYQKDKRADSAKLSRIQLHLDDLVTQMGEQLYGGQIDAEPLVVSSSKSPCTWCDYSFICCHETGLHERALEAPAKPFEPEEEPEEKEEQP